MVNIGGIMFIFWHLLAIASVFILGFLIGKRITQRVYEIKLEELEQRTIEWRARNLK
tara:strand:- start:102 stop:272 length:171 start_codon:yes stop_codon:yes gene_type:complete